MRKSFFFLMFSFIVSVSMAYAFSPTAIELEYSKEEKTLHVVVKHVALKSREDYIRRIFVTKNNEKPQKFSFASQENPAEFVFNVPLELAVGDTVKVLAICNDTGRKEETLTIVEEEIEEQEQK